MAWTDFARTDFAADDPGRTARGDYLRERDTLLGARPFALSQFTEQTQSAASWADAADFTIRTADYAVAGWFLHAYLEIKVAAGTGGMIRLVNVTDGNNGTAQTGVSNTTYALSDDLSVQVDAGEHQDVNIKVQIQGDGTNNMFARNVQGGYYYAMAWWAPS